MILECDLLYNLIRCPRCESLDIDLIDFRDFGERAKEVYRCNKCGHVFTNWLE